MADSEKFYNLTGKDFAELFGATEEEIIQFCAEHIEKSDFRYRIIDGEKKEQLILKLLKFIDSEEITVTGPQRISAWEKGWGENLQELIESGFDIDKLFPKYFRKHVSVRLNLKYVIPLDENFFVNATKLFRSWFFQKFFQNVKNIYEFGCGAAQHLAYLATIFPDKKLYGFDWTQTSQEIISLLVKHYNWSITGGYFDFFSPDENIQIEPDSAIFTFGALEQVGDNFGPFLEFILKRSPELCANIEGIIELYNQDALPDYLALKYHKRKNYLNGFLTHLRQLQEQGRIEIIKVHHQQLGNFFDDSHSYVVWRPIK